MPIEIINISKSINYNTKFVRKQMITLCQVFCSINSVSDGESAKCVLT